MLENLKKYLPLLALLVVGCSSATDETVVTPDPVDEAFYAGDRADGLGLTAAQERSLLLFLNESSAEELAQIPSCSVRATEEILKWRDEEGGIRSLYELDAVPYVGKSTFRALSTYVREQELDQDVELWEKTRPAIMADVLSTETLVFGGPTARNSNLGVFRLHTNPGDRIAFRLVPLDGTGVNTRIDIKSADKSIRIVENPYGLKEARLPVEGTPWHEGIVMESDEYVVNLINRGEPGQYMFEMRCVGGPCLSHAEQNNRFDYLFAGDLRGAADFAFMNDANEGAGIPDALERLEDEQLLFALRERYKHHHREMTYDQAREFLFVLLHNDDGLVEGVYSGVEVRTEQVPHSYVMNTEHAWPRSHGADSSAFLADLHHLYPTISWVNSARANYEYCEVDRVVGSRGEAKWGYDEDGYYCFEPRDDFKGNAARSLFYVAAAYDLKLDDTTESILRGWHVEDPVDQAERDRNLAVSQLQGSRNLFIDFPALVERVEDF